MAVNERIQSYIEVMDFTNQAVSREIVRLREKRQKLYNIRASYASKEMDTLSADISTLQAKQAELDENRRKGKPVDPAVYSKIVSDIAAKQRRLTVATAANEKAKKELYYKIDTDILEADKKLEKINRDKLSVDRLYNELVNIKNNVSNVKVQETRCRKLMEPFFREYENTYDGASVDFKMSGGESQFKKIIKQTSIYEKNQKKLDTLNKRIIQYENKLALKNKPENAELRALKNRIQRYENRKVKALGKQKVVMLRRETTIRRRNENISRLEAERDMAIKDNNTSIAYRRDKKITELKGKKIRQMPANLILFTQYMSDFARRRYFDKEGNIDTKKWTERRITELQEKAKKTL